MGARLWENRLSAPGVRRSVFGIEMLVVFGDSSFF
jgi:hypothetical protein